MSEPSMLRSFCRAIPVFLLLSALAACGGGSSAAPTPTPTPAVPYSQIDLAVGTGAEAVAGKAATVNYTGWLYDASQPEQKGRQFDTSIGKSPYTFTVGARQVIAGWDRGVAGMRVGGKRRLVIPPDLAYGSTGIGGVIPANATLVFDVDLLAVAQ